MQPVGNQSENITVDQQHEDHSFGHFDLNEIAAAFPATAETLLLDTYLTNEDAASARVFRVYRETPSHYHGSSDEYRYVLSGKGTFWTGSPANAGAFAPGHFLFFKRGTRAAADQRGSRGIPVGGRPQARSKRHHLCRSRRWEPRELHPRSKEIVGSCPRRKAGPSITTAIFDATEA
jgi:quercetin dioxygenase-like cupin family protein